MGLRFFYASFVRLKTRTYIRGIFVTQWRLNEDKCYVAKEVKVPDESIYFRETKNNGWRRYNKYTVPKYTDTSDYLINFIY